MMKKKCLFTGLVLAAVALVATGCSKSENEDVVYDMMPKTRAIELTPEQKAFVNKNTDFSFNLFRTINQTGAGRKSSIVSPISVTYVMGMLNDGAAGKTASEITSVLGFGDNAPGAVNEFCKALIEGAPVSDPSVTLKIANTVITNKYRDVKLESQFQKNMKDYYEAELFSLDFSKKSDALKQVNSWSKKHTDGMIPEILKDSELDPSALFLLMNAIYFKATWTDKFDKKDTRNGTFTTEDGQKKNLPMMHRKGQAIYSENEVCSMLNLPYGSGDQWTMNVLLPKEGKTVDDVINSLSAESWSQIWSENWHPVVDISIPRFSTTFETDLIRPIKELGAPSMFVAGEAEFPNISSNYKSGLYVSLLKQKATIDVSEEGTKATAVTVAEMSLGAAGPIYGKPENVDFHCDRPFVYIIREWTSGVIFFIGVFRG